MVSVALPGTATELADRDAVVLLGVPLTTRVAVPEKPPTEASEMPNEPLSPRATVSDGGDAEIVKSGAITESVSVVVCVADPPVPLTVSGYVPTGVVAPAVSVSCDEPGAATED